MTVGDCASESISQSHRPTASRASYQSPTKASLSRSHPTILARSPRRRSSEGRGRGLRQEILLGKANTAGAANPPPKDTPQTPQSNNDGNGTGDVDHTAQSLLPSTESFSGAVARTLADPAQAIHPQPSPLRPRQPSPRNRDANQTKRGQLTTRTIAAISQGRDFLNRHDATAEPDLPPTPTQLGLSPKPDRPRGLAASSSPSSRGSQRNRLRDVQVGTSSPLKSKEKVLAARIEEVSRHEAETGIAEEAPESDLEPPVSEPQPQRDAKVSRNDLEVPEDIATKRRLRDDLKTQVARLQAETAQLESVLNGGEDADDEVDMDLLALLSTPNMSCDPKFSETSTRPSSVAFKDPIALDINPLAFLRAFAPGDLRLTTTTKSPTYHRGKFHQVHILNISAPPPWPPHVFNAVFRVTCDVATKSIVSITGANIRPRHGAGIKELRHWMEARLKNPLHKFDAGTLVWGLGMWWKEAVARAKFFHHVNITKATETTEAQNLYRANEIVKAADVQGLIPFIGKAFIELIPAEPYSNRASTNEARKYRQTRLLLKWDLELDWAGEAHTEIDVAGTKISVQAQEGAKQVFAKLMKRNGLDEAVRQIVDVCRGGIGAGKKRNIK